MYEEYEQRLRNARLSLNAIAKKRPGRREMHKSHCSVLGLRTQNRPNSRLDSQSAALERT